MIIERMRTLAKRETQVEWIVKGLLTSGEWTYFVGEAGSGKSMMMIQLVDALQNGTSFLGMKCKQMNCLYIQVDTGRLEWQEQVSRLAGNSFAWTAYAMKDNFLDDEREVELVRQIVWGDYEKTEKNQLYRVLQGIPFNFIVFDVLNKMTARDINTKDGMSFVLSRLGYITKRGEAEDRESVHYILVHHPNKTVKRGVTAGSGYGGFGGLCGNMLTLASNLLILEKSKVISRQEILLERKPNGAWFKAEYRFDSPSNHVTKSKAMEILGVDL